MHESYTIRVEVGTQTMGRGSRASQVGRFDVSLIVGVSFVTASIAPLGIHLDC